MQSWTLTFKTKLLKSKQSDLQVINEYQLDMNGIKKNFIIDDKRTKSILFDFLNEFLIIS